MKNGRENVSEMMVEQGVFVAKLAKALQMLCHGYLEYNSTIEIIGHINLRIDNQKFDYIVNEQVSRQGGDSTYFQSNSYHSVPPGKPGNPNLDRVNGGRYEDSNALANSHQRLGENSLGGNCVKVDLSGPMPFTHSTHLMAPCSTPETYFSLAASRGGRRRSHSRDSRIRSLEEEQAVASGVNAQDHSFSHSSALTKDREEMTVNGNGTRPDSASVLALYKDLDRLKQHRQDSLKSEPNDRSDSSMEATPASGE